MAPFHRVAQRTVAGFAKVSVGFQEAKPLVETGAQLVDAQQGHAGCGHFEGQRNAVEMSADFCHAAGVSCVECEVLVGGTRALDEQGDCAKLGNFGRAGGGTASGRRR